MNMRHSSFSKGDPGRIFEIKVLGEQTASVLGFSEERHPWRSFAVCLKNALAPAVQASFNWNPAAPRTAIAYKLFMEIQDVLQRGGISRTDLRLFPTLGTALDMHHHTDFVLTCGKAMVGVDLTISKQVRAESDTHVVLRPENLDDWFAIQQAAIKIAQLLGKQIKDRRQ